MANRLNAYYRSEDKEGTHPILSRVFILKYTEDTWRVNHCFYSDRYSKGIEIDLPPGKYRIMCRIGSHLEFHQKTNFQISLNSKPTRIVRVSNSSDPFFFERVLMTHADKYAANNETTSQLIRQKGRISEAFLHYETIENLSADEIDVEIDLSNVADDFDSNINGFPEYRRIPLILRPHSKIAFAWMNSRRDPALSIPSITIFT